MKTNRTPQQWIGHSIGVILFTIVALLPTAGYGALWWFMPKSFWPVFGAVLLGALWIIVQVIWGLCVAIKWDEVNRPPARGFGEATEIMDLTFDGPNPNHWL
ncbi:MAG: hypothetical protein A2849_02960 [Candidatus Taylorbacteria bacterium RIFCSPHIGHO2_01_FULL_51_15]|uniref:Uncharacterized protein n=1 Tax=Candidatus Taylorbacteria bacterium RIFCSPHIGHO2_01_FULL_51_15 TaxID=1802304 RepID=A0A1G2M8U9_9BACT|nr:MAG: hypothetical protein A2849_02960 [Candidatus Taylorbacteria bacterium RIFCSPHIGHO2_01_FULL_51_15]